MSAESPGSPEQTSDWAKKTWKAATGGRSKQAIVDIHAHPSVKTCLLPGLLRKKFHKENANPPKEFNVFGFRADLPSLRRGGVRILGADVCSPEKGYLTGCMRIQYLANLIGPSYKRAHYGNPYCVTRAMMKDFEKVVQTADGASGGQAVAIAHGKAELATLLGKKDVVILQTLEGAHCLNGYLDHLDELFDRGVCMLSPAHHFLNGVSPPVRGIPLNYSLFTWGCYRCEPDIRLPLQTMGRLVVERMLELGMLVDVTHSTPAARADIMDLCAQYKRPVVMSHVGVFHHFNNPMNPTDQEIAKIARLGGLVGVILMEYWLGGPRKQGQKVVLNDVVETIQHLVKVGGEDCVAIGSDFDGATDPPDDLKEPAEMPRLVTALSQAGFTADQIDKVMGLNFLSVLDRGWDKP